MGAVFISEVYAIHSMLLLESAPLAVLLFILYSFVFLRLIAVYII